MRLNDLKIGQSCFINKVVAEENIKNRLMDIGFVKGVKVTLLFMNKSMTAYKIKGTVIGIRKQDTLNIEVSL